LAARSGKQLRQIIRDTKRTDFYLDATRALDYGLVDQVLGVTHASTPILSETNQPQPVTSPDEESRPSEAAAIVGNS
jgi:hypothetical protein